MAASTVTTEQRRRVTAERKQFTKDELRQHIHARFAVKLRALMDERRWEVSDLHDRLTAMGAVLGKPAIHKWLRAENRPSWEDMQRLGKIFFPENWRLIFPD